MSRRLTDWLQQCAARFLTRSQMARTRKRRHSSVLQTEPLEARILLAGDPTLTIVLNQVSMTEQAGGNGVTASVQRSNADLSQALTVNLHSSDPTEASVPNTVVIAAGATSA